MSKFQLKHLAAVFLLVLYQAAVLADGNKNYANCWHSNLNSDDVDTGRHDNIDGNYICMKSIETSERGWCRLDNNSCYNNTNFTHEGNCKESDHYFDATGALSSGALGDDATYYDSACVYRKDEKGSEKYAGCIENAVYGGFTCRESTVVTKDGDVTEVGAGDVGWCSDDDVTCNGYPSSNDCDKTNPIFTNGVYDSLWALREDYCSFDNNKKPPCYHGTHTALQCKDLEYKDSWDDDECKDECQSHYYGQSGWEKMYQCKWNYDDKGAGYCNNSGFVCDG